MSPELAELAEAAIKGARAEYIVRQQVSTIHKSWLVDISSSPYERQARADYDRAVKDHPDGYFELVMVMTCEVCRAFTPKKDAPT